MVESPADGSSLADSHRGRRNSTLDLNEEHPRLVAEPPAAEESGSTFLGEDTLCAGPADVIVDLGNGIPKSNKLGT